MKMLPGDVTFSGSIQQDLLITPPPATLTIQGQFAASTGPFGTIWSDRIELHVHRDGRDVNAWEVIELVLKQ